jgi:hypothetical protein
VINIFETILKVWCDIGKNGMKYFKEDMIWDIEKDSSLIYWKKLEERVNQCW